MAFSGYGMQPSTSKHHVASDNGLLIFTIQTVVRLFLLTCSAIAVYCVRLKLPVLKRDFALRLAAEVMFYRFAVCTRECFFGICTVTRRREVSSDESFVVSSHCSTGTFFGCKSLFLSFLFSQARNELGTGT